MEVTVSRGGGGIARGGSLQGGGGGEHPFDKPPPQIHMGSINIMKLTFRTVGCGKGPKLGIG